MNWQDILKDSKLDSVQDTVMSVKPEEQNKDCFRVLKTLLKKLRRLPNIPTFHEEFPHKKLPDMSMVENNYFDTGYEFSHDEYFVRIYLEWGHWFIKTEQEACELLDAIKNYGAFDASRKLSDPPTGGLVQIKHNYEEYEDPSELHLYAEVIVFDLDAYGEKRLGKLEFKMLSRDEDRELPEKVKDLARGLFKETIDYLNNIVRQVVS